VRLSYRLRRQAVLVYPARDKVWGTQVLESVIRYRDGKKRDTLDIVDFQIAMARETEGIDLNRFICSRGVEAVFEDRNLGRYFVAESEGDLVASLMITYEWSDWRNGVVWWIQSVYVRPEFRRRGIYAALYQHVKGIAENLETVKGIRLYVDRRNEPAQEVYRRLGMNGEHYQVFEWMK
jgi:ribosomal protein S18 acetylase RimI-like enzyme